MTILQIVNRVLRRLREETVTSLAETEYSYMVCEMLHDIHQEMLEHDWSSMEHVVDVPVVAAQRTLDLTRTESSGGDVASTSRVTTNDSVLRYNDGLPLAWVFDTSSSTQGDQLYQLSEEQMEQLYQSDRSQTNDDPAYFSLRRSPDRDGWQMTIWPAPTAARHIRLRFWTPEDEVDPDSDDTRTLLVPSRPLLLGTIMLALNERGEEMGEPGNVAERRYYDALGAAIEADQTTRAKTNRFESWRE